MTFQFAKKILPSWQNALLAVLAAILLILAFPDFEYWFLAWFALLPLMWAVERQKQCVAACFSLGWIFGTIFFFGTCWWLTFAPITYAGFPPILAYFLLFIVTALTGLFPAIFAGMLSVMLRRFGSCGFLAAPFIWVFTEFLRYWVTGNNWNAIAYSQALTSTYEASSSSGLISFVAIGLARFGGVAVVSFVGLIPGSLIIFILTGRTKNSLILGAGLIVVSFFGFAVAALTNLSNGQSGADTTVARVVAVQPNVPMAGLDNQKLNQLRQRQTGQAETALSQQSIKDKAKGLNSELPTTVILPESPMNFMYTDDREFQRFIGDFARRNHVSVLFNSAEPDKTNGKYFNSAVMVSPEGRDVAQYDKIYLLPFGEAVPQMFENILPGFVGNFSYGGEYDIMPLGNAKAGVMICFESHFGQLSREYVRNGADVLIEMTNDGYLGPTPILRQHLANAVFRAIETNRPVIRVTNVGITAYINEKGAVLDAALPYQEDTRTWNVSETDGKQTFYVRYGDWFAWLCSVVTIFLIIFARSKKRQKHDR